MNNLKTIYFDSNVFIYALTYDHQLEDFKKSDYYLGCLARGEIAGYTSTLTWDEVVYVIYKKYGVKKAIETSKYLLSFPNLEFINVDFSVISAAQQIAEDSHIMPRDAIHAVCAIKSCNGKIISNDTDFDGISKIERIFNSSIA